MLQSLTVGLFLTAIAIIGFGFSSSMVVSLITQLFIGAGLINYMATTNTLLQIFVSDELRGRVMSFYTLSFIGIAPLGALLVGYIGERLGPQTAVVICGALALGCAVLLLTRLEVIRKGAGRGCGGGVRAGAVENHAGARRAHGL